MQRALLLRSMLATSAARELLVAQYRAFLALARQPGPVRLVPTVAIDMVWHTHQMHPKRYARECSAIAGMVLDHDDTAEEDALDAGFRTTSAAWHAHLKAPGCIASLRGNRRANLIVDYA